MVAMYLMVYTRATNRFIKLCSVILLYICIQFLNAKQSFICMREPVEAVNQWSMAPDKMKRSALGQACNLL